MTLGNYNLVPAPVLRDKSIAEEIKKSFDIKNVMKRFGAAMHDVIGGPFAPIKRHSISENGNSCNLTYVWLTNQTTSGGFFVSENVEVNIEIKLGQGIHNLDNCPYRRELELIKEENNK